MSSPEAAAVASPFEAPGNGPAVRLAVLSDTHISPAGAPDGVWDNAIRRTPGPGTAAVPGDLGAHWPAERPRPRRAQHSYRRGCTTRHAVPR
jgi:hypothetical protein